MVKSKSPALDVAMMVMDGIANKVKEEKLIEIRLTHRNAFLDILVTDTDKKPNLELEKIIFDALVKVLGPKYGIDPNSWETEHIE
jgi:hypothetical protein